MSTAKRERPLKRASHDGFLEIASEHHFNFFLRFPEAAERLVLGLARRKDIACGILAR
jgi:hypothetical protein